MVFETWSEFFDMGGRGFFVWGCYLVTLFAIIIELVIIRNRRQTAMSQLKQYIRMKRVQNDESKT